ILGVHRDDARRGLREPLGPPRSDDRDLLRERGGRKRDLDRRRGVLREAHDAGEVSLRLDAERGRRGSAFRDLQREPAQRIRRGGGEVAGALDSDDRARDGPPRGIPNRAADPRGGRGGRDDGEKKQENQRKPSGWRRSGRSRTPLDPHASSLLELARNRRLPLHSEAMNIARIALPALLLALPAGEGKGEGKTFVYVTNEKSGNVTVIDSSTDKAVDTIPVGSRPRGVQASPDGKRIYVAVSDRADKSKESITVMDTASRKVVARLPSGVDPEQFAVSPDGKLALIADEDANAAGFLDLAAGKILATLPLGTGPEGGGTTPGGRVRVGAAASSHNTTSFAPAP